MDEIICLVHKYKLQLGSCKSWDPLDPARCGDELGFRRGPLVKLSPAMFVPSGSAPAWRLSSWHLHLGKHSSGGGVRVELKWEGSRQVVERLCHKLRWFLTLDEKVCGRKWHGVLRESMHFEANHIRPRQLSSGYPLSGTSCHS